MRSQLKCHKRKLLPGKWEGICSIWWSDCIDQCCDYLVSSPWALSFCNLYFVLEWILNYDVFLLLYFACVRMWAPIMSVLKYYWVSSGKKCPCSSGILFCVERWNQWNIRSYFWLFLNEYNFAKYFTQVRCSNFSSCVWQFWYLLSDSIHVNCQNAQVVIGYLHGLYQPFILISLNTSFHFSDSKATIKIHTHTHSAQQQKQMINQNWVIKMLVNIFTTFVDSWTRKYMKLIFISSLLRFLWLPLILILLWVSGQCLHGKCEMYVSF